MMNLKYRIDDIRDPETMMTKTDEYSQKRIGCLVERPVVEPRTGCAVVVYLEDKDGNEKSGYMRTSPVQRVEEIAFTMRIRTLNTIYVFKEVEE